MEEEGSEATTVGEIHAQVGTIIYEVLNDVSSRPSQTPNQIMNFYPVKANSDTMASHSLLGLWKARRNILAPFSEAEFSRKLFEFRIPRQKYIVCNAPEHVREAFMGACLRA